MVVSAPRHLLHSKYVDIGVDLNGGVVVYVDDGVKALDQLGCQCLHSKYVDLVWI